MERAGERREVVYCHSCEDEFYRDEHGLTCPRCHSDFCEIIEEVNRDPSLRDLQSHNPWDAPDPDEDDIGQFGSHNMPGAFNSSSGSGRGHQGPQFGLESNFLRMLSGMGGAQGFERHFSPPPSEPVSPIHSHSSTDRSRSAPGARTMSGGRTGRSNISFSFQSTSFGPDGPRTFSYSSHGGNPPQFNDLMSGFMAPHRGAGPPMSPFGGGEAGGQMGPAGSLMDILAAMLNPALARSGDAVYSQEALDRIMTQLMEEHQSGNAPGPASESAIASLPRKPLDLTHTDGSREGAECSICMETVALGKEVVELPCHHWFHYECAKMWLSEHDTCPICRSGITPKDGDRDTVRQPSQPPLHDEGPANVVRRESSGMEDWRPGSRRSSSRTQEAGGGGGIAGRLRSFLSRDPSSSDSRQQQHEDSRRR